MRGEGSQMWSAFPGIVVEVAHASRRLLTLSVRSCRVLTTDLHPRRLTRASYFYTSDHRSLPVCAPHCYAEADRHHNDEGLNPFDHLNSSRGRQCGKPPRLFAEECWEKQYGCDDSNDRRPRGSAQQHHYGSDAQPEADEQQNKTSDSDSRDFRVVSRFNSHLKGEQHIQNELCSEGDHQRFLCIRELHSAVRTGHVPFLSLIWDCTIVTFSVEASNSALRSSGVMPPSYARSASLPK